MPEHSLKPTKLQQNVRRVKAKHDKVIDKARHPFTHVVRIESPKK